jgi:16S rRNA processing protein RimM
MDRRRIVIAEVLRPRGNRGELLVRSETDVRGRLAHLKKAFVHLPSGEDANVEVERSWAHNEHWVVKLAGVDSIDAAERFRGADLWVPLEERGHLGKGEFFQSDLVGLTVVHRVTGERIGPVKGWQAYGGAPLMEVNHSGREVLIPFIAEACDVDLEARTLSLDIPEGLLELDQP